MPLGRSFGFLRFFIQVMTVVQLSSEHKSLFCQLGLKSISAEWHLILSKVEERPCQDKTASSRIIVLPDLYGCQFRAPHVIAITEKLSLSPSLIEKLRASLTLFRRPVDQREAFTLPFTSFDCQFAPFLSQHYTPRPFRKV